jgi:hypothetical protein
VESAHNPFGTALKDAQNKSKQDNGSTEIVQHIGFHPALSPVITKNATKTRPPTFVLWTNSTYGEFPWTYLRQLRNAMREEFRISVGTKMGIRGRRRFFTCESS